MNIKELAKQLRLILFRKCDCNELTTEFERVFELCGCDYEVNIMEDDKVIIIDIPSCIQFIKKKGKTCKIYEVIPEGSPLEKYKEIKSWQKKKPLLSKSEERRMKIQRASLR